MPEERKMPYHWPERGLFPVVVAGTSHYERQIRRIAKNAYYEPALTFCSVKLTAEDHNTHDPNAVLVSIDTIALGHLPRELAADFRSRLKNCQLEGEETTCAAVITAGHETTEQRYNYRIELDLHLFDIPNRTAPKYPRPFLRNGYPEPSSIGGGRYVIRVFLPAGLLDDMDKNGTINSWSREGSDKVSYYAQNRVGLGSGYWLFAIPRKNHEELFGEKQASASFRSISGRQAVIELASEA
ncbi:hypothetical protein FQY83_04190 [Luteimonas marina]|uniref:HIRAN domain-containing protein n=1 Tax=Luteimonas marina TaxID=488485 RepID=A0A5C5U9L0_9GAMM|nr:HIRAN domain-containing protein [Luteimonas marina]TWT22240.1 hypothetical protein FQY83_04190 [Luteimonas marina]